MEQNSKIVKKSLIMLISSCAVALIVTVAVIIKVPIPDASLTAASSEYSELPYAQFCTFSPNPTANETVEASPAADSTDTADSVQKSTAAVHYAERNPEDYILSGELPERERVEADYFDDAVFIGDSVTLALKNYEASKNVLGNAAFLASGSFGSGNALKPVSADSTHPKYNGVKLSVEDAVASTGKKRVYIMLGMNDLAVYGIEGSVKNLEALCDNIIKKSPYVLIYIQSMTPKISATDNPSHKLCNNNIAIYNKRLNDLCISRGWYFVNVASVMYDGYGCLLDGYCSDRNGMGLHFNQAGCQAWVNYLYTHAFDPSFETPTPSVITEITPFYENDGDYATPLNSPLISDRI